MTASRCARRPACLPRRAVAVLRLSLAQVATMCPRCYALVLSHLEQARAGGRTQ